MRVLLPGSIDGCDGVSDGNGMEVPGRECRTVQNGYGWTIDAC